MKRIILTSILSFLIVLVFNFTLPQKDSSPTMKDWFWTFKTHDSKKYDVVVIGDSRVQRGISPAHMSKFVINTSIINLGYSSLGFNSEIFKFIDSKLTLNDNSSVVLGLTPHSLTRRAAENEHYHQEKNRDKFDIFLRKNGRLFFSWIEPISILKTSKQLLKTKDRYFETFYNTGWTKSDRIPEDSTRALVSYQDNLLSNEISTENIENLLLMISEWKNSGVSVFGLRPPTTTKMEQVEESLLNFNYDQFIRDFERVGGIWIEQPKACTTYDGSHLNSRSAIILSEFVAVALKNHQVDK